MGNLTLVLGGARSGKSAAAVRMAEQGCGDNVLYVATADPGDEEMQLRIDKHRAERSAEWRTVEARHSVGQAIRRQPGRYSSVVVDCVTLLVSNLLVDQADPYAEEVLERVEQEIGALVEAARALPPHCDTIVVSNEVGTGLAPVTPLGRAFRDRLGQANQRLAAAADRVVLMVAGIPVVLKDGAAAGGATTGAAAGAAGVMESDE